MFPDAMIVAHLLPTVLAFEPLRHRFSLIFNRFRR
jgi:hypothetical protein